LRAYLRLLRFAAPYKLRIVAAMLCMLLLSLTTAAYANLIGPALEFLFTGQAKSLGALRNFVPARVDLDALLAGLDRRRLLAVLPLVIMAVAMLKGVAAFGQQFITGMVGQRVVADVRRAVFDNLLRLSPAYYAQRSSGDIQSRVSGTCGPSTRRSRPPSRATSATG
jgi:subfamily B ATP-binding cassette protein MsbA